MPFYDFKRSDGEIVTHLLTVAERNIDRCPDTGMKMERLMFTKAPAIRTAASFRDGSPTNNNISQAYYESVTKRKASKSKETIAEERGEI